MFTELGPTHPPSWDGWEVELEASKRQDYAPPRPSHFSVKYRAGAGMEGGAMLRIRPPMLHLPFSEPRAGRPALSEKVAAEVGGEVR